MEQKPYNLTKLEDIAQGDEDFVHEMLVTFVENVTEDVEKVQSLRLSENWKTIAEIAHRLASRFAYLSITSLQTLSIDIETSVLKDNNLGGISEKTDRLCREAIDVVGLLKIDFEFLFANSV